MEQELLVLVARQEQLQEKANEVRKRGLEVIGAMCAASILYVRGDPRKLEGMTGVTIRKQEKLEGRA